MASTETGATTTTADDSGTSTPRDMPNAGDTDGESTTSETSGDGDGEPGDGDGDGDSGPGCGNGVIDDGEQCDGDNLAGYDCLSLGYSGGTLVCDPIVCTFDASDCVPGQGGGTWGD